jgi:intracellular septation protein A
MVKEKKRENPILSILLNIVIPVLILTKLNERWEWQPVSLLLIALSFPLIYGITDFFKRSKFNWISAIGVFSVLYTGIIGLLALPPNWIAIKEAFVPFAIGLVVVVSIFRDKPLINKLLMSEELFKTELIKTKIEENHATDDYNKFMKSMTWFLAGTFAFSSALNYILAKIIVISNSGTPEFNNEIGRLTALSFPVIALPSTLMIMIILFLVIKKIRKYTGLKFDEIVIEK